MAAHSPAALLAVVQSHGPAMDFFNISSALSRLPKLLESLPVGNSGDTGSGNSASGSGVGSASGSGLDLAARLVADALGALLVQHVDSFDARGEAGWGAWFIPWRAVLSSPSAAVNC